MRIVSAGRSAAASATPPAPLSHHRTSHVFGPLYRNESITESNSSGRPTCACANTPPSAEMDASRSATTSAGASRLLASSIATRCCADFAAASAAASTSSPFTSASVSTRARAPSSSRSTMDTFEALAPSSASISSRTSG